MKKVLVKFAAVAVFGVLTFASCKKDDKNNSASLVGNWTLSEIGADANSNNNLDAGETGPAAQSGFSGSANFRSDNTYTTVYSIAGFSDTETGTYTYANNTLTTISQRDTTVILVKELTNNRLVIKTEQQWGVFTK
jgi:hypothetical protein